MASPDAPPRLRLFVCLPLAAGQDVTLEDAQAHYLAHVMRARVGETIALFNGIDGEWEADITEIRKKTVTLLPRAQRRPQRPGPDLWLVFAPLKHGRIDYLAQKATELGISVLCPVGTRHTVASRLNEDRLRANAIEAAEQSERLDVPDIRPLTPLSTLLGSWPAERRLIFGDESGRSPPIRELAATLPANVPCAALTGPEGGFAPAELELLHSLPYASGVSLGPRVLRANTAALALLACLQAFAGDWGERPRFHPTA